MDSKTVKKKPVSAAPMPITAVSQAANRFPQLMKNHTFCTWSITQ
jgi:hypothetical protein